MEPVGRRADCPRSTDFHVVSFAKTSAGIVVFGERHLRRVLTSYFAYYDRARTHLSLDKDAPDKRPIEPPAPGAIVSVPEVGGLHQRYVRRPA
jgi:hypothetical protein